MPPWGFSMLSFVNLFYQNMLHVDALNLADSNISKEVYDKVTAHYKGLSKRPDYDGYVSIAEGIKWAKRHPYALKGPTPDNTLYIDASKLDFGFLSTDDYPEEGASYTRNLFSKNFFLTYLKNKKFRDTTYGLGEFKAVLVNREDRTISIIDGGGTDYDWNRGGGKLRDRLIRINNAIFNLNPAIHGFKVKYYGQGKLNE